MISFAIYAAIYLAFTIALAYFMRTVYESWWKGLGIVLLVQVGVVALFVILTLASALSERGL